MTRSGTKPSAPRGLRTWLRANYGFGFRFAWDTAMLHLKTGREEFA